MLLYLLFCCFISIFFFHPITSSELCSDSHCIGDYQTIRFPFRIEGRQLKSCGYPGFDLSCHANGQPLLHLPSSGDFSVQYIDYDKQQISINDPDGCLPRKMLSFNLSGSPFVEKYDQALTFFNCSANESLPYDLSLNSIACLSSLSHKVFASYSMYSNALLSNCTRIKTILVSIPWLTVLDPSDDILLKWEEPNCKWCEVQGGRCELKPNSIDEIQCTNPRPGRGIPRGIGYAVSLGVGVPAALCFLAFLCYFFARLRFFSRGRNSGIEAHWIVSSRASTTMGLDGPTIDSYPKIVLGESLRLSEPNDDVCPICLAHYRPKQTVKTIPDCHHCFHHDCIDEWLRLNASCPVCRNSPLKSLPFNPP